MTPDTEKPSNTAEEQPKDLQLVYVKDEPVNVQIDWDYRGNIIMRKIMTLAFNLHILKINKFKS